MDRTGCPKFAVNFRIATLKTTFAHGNIVLHADIVCFLISVIKAGSQYRLSLSGHAEIENWRCRIFNQIWIEAQDNPDPDLFKSTPWIRLTEYSFICELVLKLLKLLTIQVDGVLEPVGVICWVWLRTSCLSAPG